MSYILDDLNDIDRGTGIGGSGPTNLPPDIDLFGIGE
jgi:hypothetical protein